MTREEVMAMSQPSSGFLSDGVPYLAIGEGPPLVKVEGLTPTHDVPTGWMRRMYLSTIAPLSGDFRVYWVNRKKGLQPGESMSDVAGHLATAIEEEFGEPVFLTARLSAWAEASNSVGSVRFHDGLTLLGAADVRKEGQARVASLRVIGLSVGRHEITAQLVGPLGLASAASAPVVHVVVAPTRR